MSTADSLFCGPQLFPGVCLRPPRDLRSQEHSISTWSSQFFTDYLPLVRFGRLSFKQREKQRIATAKSKHNCLFKTGNHSELSHFKHAALFLMKLLCKYQPQHKNRLQSHLLAPPSSPHTSQSTQGLTVCEFHCWYPLP